MGRAVLPDEARSINRQRDVQILQRHIVDQLIVTALKKGRVDGEHGLKPIARHACGQSDRVLLRNGNIEVPVRILFGVGHHARAFTHCWCNTHDSVILGCEVA